MLHSDYWIHHISPLLLLFLLSLFFRLAYIWQLLIFSLNELKTSVSSRVAYLDYHCLLAQWMEVSSLWRQPGSQSRHVTLKPLYGFHSTKGHPHFLTFIIWLDFEKDTTVVRSSGTVWCAKYWLKLLKIQPLELTLSLTQTVDKPSCHVCSHFMYDMK